MNRKETIILTREDLIERFKRQPIEDIQMNSFLVTYDAFRLNRFVLFLDDDGQPKYIKNAYGPYYIGINPNT